MGLKLDTFVDRCLGIATERGLSSSKPIVLVVKAPNTGEETRIVVSYSEPYDLILPLNVSWINGDVASPDYKKTFKRTSKTAAGGFTHSWTQISNYDDVFTPPQYWDGTDLPVVESTLSDMNSHMAETTADDDVHGSRAYIDSEVNQLTSSFGSAYANMNQRVVYNDQRIRALETAKNTHSETLATLEAGQISQNEEIEQLKNRVFVLEESGGSSGGGSGAVSYTHVVVDAALTWTIPHNMDTKNLICQVYDEQFNLVLPAGTSKVDDNTWVVSFAVPQSGRAVLIST